MLLSQSLGCAVAFVAAPRRWHSSASLDLPAAMRPVFVPAAAAADAAPRVELAAPGSGGRVALLAGVLATAVAALKSQRRQRPAIVRYCVNRMPAQPGMPTSDQSRGPSYRTWVNLRRRARWADGKRLRFYKQQQILKESGMTCAKGGYHKWYPNRETFNLYKGPESHPNNPWFPAASPGYGQALGDWAPARLAATVPPSGRASAFAGVSPMRPVRGGRGAGSALVLHAHKKAASSTRNQGHKNNPHYWGLTKKGHQGSAVKAGQLLAKQKGMNWYAGANVARGKDYSLVALRDGIVQWRGEYRHREVMIVPWEYVREKCQWVNPNTLGPKEYEPWMGTHNYGKRHHILQLRREWLKTEKGQEWLKKKNEKKERQKIIQKKIRAYTKLKKQGKVPQKEETVAAGAESEGEA